MNFFQFPKIFILCILPVIILGCQASKSKVGGILNLDTDLQIHFEVDSDINPDELGVASPLFVRLYELKSTKLMKKADFIEIYERDKEVLGADLITVYKLPHFNPGQNRDEHFVLQKDTTYVGLYAEFLTFEGSQFKLIIPVVANNVFNNSVTIKVSANKMSIIDQ